MEQSAVKMRTRLEGYGACLHPNKETDIIKTDLFSGKTVLMTKSLMNNYKATKMSMFSMSMSSNSAWLYP